MSGLLDAAKRLAALDPLIADEDGLTMCIGCDADPPYGPTGTPFVHAPDCPTLAGPRIVAALEAAERVVFLEYGPVNAFGRCHWCDEFSSTENHTPDCLWQALVVALAGEEVRA